MISVQKIKWHVAKALLSIEEQRQKLKACNNPEVWPKIEELEIRRDSFYHLSSVINFLSEN